MRPWKEAGRQAGETQLLHFAATQYFMKFWSIRIRQLPPLPHFNFTWVSEKAKKMEIKLRLNTASVLRMCALAQVTQNGWVYLVLIACRAACIFLQKLVNSLAACTAVAWLLVVWQNHTGFTQFCFLSGYVSIKAVSLPKPQRMRQRGKNSKAVSETVLK